jgi:beta-N-acetylhexosaminidase
MILSASVLGQTTLKNKISQMIMTGFISGSDFEDTLMTDIAERNLGGVILFGQNIDNPQQLRDLTDQLNSGASVPLFISIDQEGGRVARLKENNGYQNTYTAYQLGSIFQSEDSTRAQAAMMAQWLRDAGINVNLAPVADVNVDSTSPAIGNLKRSFSSDPFTVYQHASWFIDEFHKKNIVTTLKHFPGHGSAKDDSHLGFTDITQTWSDSELIPYQLLIADGYSDLVMTGHLFNANIDTTYPASLSASAIDSLLRNELGFSGLVISDEMFMQAISSNYGFEEAIEYAVNAGTDVLLFRNNEYEGLSLVDHVIETIYSKVNEGKISEGRIDEAYNRIINLKDNWFVSSLEDVLAQNQLPTDFSISNYPNPFNASTVINFTIPDVETGHAPSLRTRLSVFDILGREVALLYRGELTPGRHTFEFGGDYLSSGVYIVTMQTSKTLISHKMMLMK